MKRIPMSPGDQDRLLELMEEYRKIRIMQYDLAQDVKEISKEILYIFKTHGITERVYKNKLFKITTYIKYIYPELFIQKLRKNKLTKKISSESIRMSSIY